MAQRRPRIAVYGSSTAQEGDETYRMAQELGGALARAGADVVTGGYSGVMEACSRGAHEAGGHVIGITVELFESPSIVRPTSLGSFVRRNASSRSSIASLRPRN